MSPPLCRSQRRWYHAAARITLIALWSALVVLAPMCWPAEEPSAVGDGDPFKLAPVLAAGRNGLLTYPFRWSGDMRLVAGWQYSDGAYHGAIDYSKTTSSNKAGWQRFDVLSAAPGDACWQSGGGHDPGPQVRIQHIGSFETRYQHLSAVESSIPACPDTVSIGRAFKIGVSGDRSWIDRCPPPCVHLHFEVRQGGRLVDPYDLYSVPFRYPQPNVRHPGLMGASYRWLGDPPSSPDEDKNPPQILLAAPAPNAWYHANESISWKITDKPGSGVRGFNLGWDREAPGLPAKTLTDSGAVHLSDGGRGVHTLQIRAWDVSGNEATATVGWYGYDPDPPTPPSAATEVHGAPNDQPQNSVRQPEFTWQGATDVGFGITGYEVYWGTSPTGTAANWTTDQRWRPGPTAPGAYYLRARTADGAGNYSPWVTLFTFRYQS
jgi:murein DD-endopeptidase MepM/ murein hydrolase activator NlpD